MLLTRDQMLKVEGRKFKTITVEELGGDIRVASLSAGASLELKKLGGTGEDHDRAMALVMFTSSIVDVQGKPVFDGDDAVATFLDTISVETLKFILMEITSLSPKKTEANGAEVAGENPSAAAPSASSPSA